MTAEAANRTFFKTYDPDFLQEFGAWEESPAVVEPSRKGSPTLVLDGRHVHSSYDPLKEAMKAVGPGRSFLHVHLGFGLGYLVDADHTAEHGSMVIYEPDRRLLAATLRHRDLSTLLRERNARLCCTPKRFEALIFAGMKPNQKYKLAVLPYHARQFSKVWKQLPTTVERLYHQLIITMRTIRQSTPLLTTGALKALPYTTRLPGVEQLRECMAGKPAVVVAAGPSLDKNIADLAAAAPHCVVIAIGRTARPLEKWNVAPDFLVHNEPKPFIQFIEGCRNLSRTAFVLSGQADTAYYEHQHGPTFVSQNVTNFTNRWMCEHFPQLKRGYVDTGGSVANEAFDLAVLMGCNPVILTGQDLAMKGRQYYGNAETNIAFQHGQGDVRQVPGFFGGQVTTVSTWQGYIHWFENKASHLRTERPDLRLINATEGGAAIAGFENMSLQEAMFRFARTPVHTEAVVRNRAKTATGTTLTPEQLQAHATAFSKRLDILDGLIHDFKPVAEKLHNLLDTFTPSNVSRLQQYLSLLDQFRNAYLQSQEGFLVLSGFMQDTLLAVEAARRQEAASPAQGDETAVFLENTRRDLRHLEATFQATGSASRQLRPLLAALAGNPSSSHRAS